MNRHRTTHKDSKKATLARIKEEMAAPRMAKSARDASAKSNAAQGLGQNLKKKKRQRLQRAN